MLLVLATLSGCWQPAPYTPPPAPGEEPGDEAAAEAPGERTEDAPAGEAAEGAEGDVEAEGTGDAPPEDDEEIEDAPPFASYPARTVQSPVTIVDDWGKPLAVLGSSGWALDVRGEDTIRTRVWCGTCSPPVEGWIQAHLVERAQ